MFAVLLVLGAAGWMAAHPPPPAWAWTCAAAPRSSSRPRTPRRSRPTRESTDRALEVLRRRVDALGVAEPTLPRSGERRIIVELPGVLGPRARPPRSSAGPPSSPSTRCWAWPSPPPANRPRPSPAGRRRRAGPGRRGRRPAAARPGRAHRRGVDGRRAPSSTRSQAGWQVAIDFQGDGGRRWAAADRRGGLPAARATRAAGRHRARRPGHLPPPGRPARSPASRASPAARRRSPATSPARRPRTWPLLIRGGALPVPVEVIEQRTVGPTLGAAAIEASAQAAVHRRRP